MLILFAGPQGSSEERGARLFDGHGDADVLPVDSVDALLHSVEWTPGVSGVLPVESTLHGDLALSLDRMLLRTERAVFVGEAILSERIVLAGRPDADPDITTVLSHGDILTFCSDYLTNSGLELRQMPSTAAACQAIRDGERNAAALAPPELAVEHGLTVLNESVSDFPQMRTRYYLVGRDLPQPTGDDLTMVALFPADDRAGLLREMLQPFEAEGANLHKLISRPWGAGAHPYAFIVTAEGHVRDEPLRRTIAALEGADLADVRVLGAFPRSPDRLVISPFVA